MTSNKLLDNRYGDMMGFYAEYSALRVFLARNLYTHPYQYNILGSCQVFMTVHMLIPLYLVTCLNIVRIAFNSFNTVEN